MNQKAALILAAAGKGERAGQDKLWADINGVPVLEITLRAVSRAACFSEIIIVADVLQHANIAELAQRIGLESVKCEPGGTTRQESVEFGLSAVGDADIVCIHDAARPLCPPGLFAEVVASAREHGAATAAVPVTDTIKETKNGAVVRTLPRDSLVAVQTPQAFRTQLLRDAHAAAPDKDAVDDCVLVERTGAQVAIVTGDQQNRKLTNAVDIEWLRLATRIATETNA